MALGPAPWRTIFRKPLAFGFAGASRAARPPPEPVALIVCFPPRLPRASTAPRSAAAVLAFVARAVRRHQHAALGASRRAFMGIARLCRQVGEGERGSCGFNKGGI